MYYQSSDKRSLADWTVFNQKTQSRSELTEDQIKNYEECFGMIMKKSGSRN